MGRVAIIPTLPVSESSAVALVVDTGIRSCLGHRVGDEGSAAVDSLDESSVAQDLGGSPNSEVGDAVFLREISLSGQACSWT